MWIVIAVSTLTVLILVLLCLPSRYHDTRSDLCSVTVLVLGDLGRSPRMQYHALSIARHHGSVQLVGYLDTLPIQELQQHKKVKIIGIPSPSRWLQTSSRILFLLTAPVKVLLQVWYLLRTLGYSTASSKWLLLQNPPSIPTLFVAVLVCVFRRQKMIIDWHNFGYSILALKLGPKHPLVTVAKVYEYVFAQFADVHFTVTNAMARELRSRISAASPILTLHDRPAEIYQPLDNVMRLGFLQRYATIAPHLDALVQGKARLLVSSTSWTADEDFSIFLQALQHYSNEAISTQPQLPELVVVITGKGPLKNRYLSQVERMKSTDQLEMVHIHTDWLSFPDYASLLGSADLGVSLHMSSSGVDLPMKVVDMFGAGLPVLGWGNFAAWPELVKEGINGRGFSSAEEMAAILCELFIPGNPQLARLRKGALKESERRWDDEWSPVACKIFQIDI